MVIPGTEPSAIFITPLNFHISHLVLKTTTGSGQGRYCPILWTRHQPHFPNEAGLSHMTNCYRMGTRTLIFLLQGRCLSCTVLCATKDMWRHFKWPRLRDCSYNPSWLAADLPEAISRLLMLFHIKQVWEWVTWLAQTSKVIASALLGNSSPPFAWG